MFGAPDRFGLVGCTSLFLTLPSTTRGTLGAARRQISQQTQGPSSLILGGAANLTDPQKSRRRS